MNNGKGKVPDVSIDEALRMFMTIVSPQTLPEDGSQSELFNVLKNKIARDRPAWARACDSTGEAEPGSAGEQAESYAELKRRIALAAVREPVPEDPEERYLYNRRKEARENRLKKEAEEAEASRSKNLTDRLLQRKKSSAKEERARFDLLKKALSKRLLKTAGPEFTAADLKAATFSDNRELPDNRLLNQFSENPPQDELHPEGNLLNEYSGSRRQEHGDGLTTEDRAESEFSFFEPESPVMERRKTAHAKRDYFLASSRANQRASGEQEEKTETKPKPRGNWGASVFCADEEHLEPKRKDSFRADSHFTLSMDGAVRKTNGLNNKFSVSIKSKRERGLKL
jgi:hypothetical protein